jgi:Peptidase family M28
MASLPLENTGALTGPAVGGEIEAGLREVVERLAPLEREAGSPGEREAAEWIAGRLTEAGCRTDLDEERFRDGFAGMMAGLAAAGAIGGVAGLSRRGRKLGALLGAVAAGLIADDASNGVRPLRRSVAASKTTWNVVAEAGDRGAERTLVVLAHHDAAHSGLIFDPTFQRRLITALPGVIERIDTAVPVWWPVVGFPGLVSFGASKGRRGATVAGLVGCVISAAAFLDIHRRPVVPGANDNLSAVAALVVLAETLRDRPVEGLRVMLVSCGAEEVLQGGIYGFAERHLSRLDPERTWVLNLDTLGSPELTLLEGEGPLVMEDYFDRGFRELIARTADREGLPLRRGMRARSSTDAVVPSRRCFPTATLTSLDRYKALSNYHRPTDVPDNLSYRTIAHAAMLSEAVIHQLAPARG